MKKLLVLSLGIAAFAFTGSAQNRFEGHNIILDVPTTHREASCAIRYAPPATTVTLTDLDRATPMKVSSCDGGSTPVQGCAGKATLPANSADYKWCFQGE